MGNTATLRSSRRSKANSESISSFEYINEDITSSRTSRSSSLTRFFMGDNIETVAESLSRDLVDTFNSSDVYADALAETCQNLLGRTRDPICISGRTDEEASTTSLSANNHDDHLSSELWIIFFRIFLSVHMDRFQDADVLICKFKKLTKKKMTLPHLLKHLLAFYEGLTAAVLALHADCRDKRHRLNSALKILRKYRSRDVHGDSLMCNKIFLLDAQIHAARGQHETALLLFHKSADLAEDQGFTHEQGLAYELAGRMCQQCSNRAVETDLYLSQARDCFSRWGAVAKVDQLDLELSGCGINSMGVSSQSNYSSQSGSARSHSGRFSSGRSSSSRLG